MKRILALVTLALTTLGATAQPNPQKESAQAPAGSIVYTLPRTAVKLKVQVVKESYVEGPYAAYAQKYLSIDVAKRSPDSYTIQSISIMPFQESDPSQAYVLNIGGMKNGRANFLAMSSEGMVLPAGYDGSAFGQARYAVVPQKKLSFYDTGAEPNFVNETATYYNTVKTDTGMVRVPVQRAQLVEKNPEKKAEDAANLIFNLRKKRIDLITGESDNIPSGEGLGAALREMKRLEDEYLSLFIGKTYSGTETYYFDVVPDASQNKQSYIAFRFSESQGVVPSNNVSGRPILLELQPEKSAGKDMARDDSGKVAYIYYRVPQTVQVRLLDGSHVLIQDRIPVLQLGQMLAIPAEAAMK